jgi:hypothetical protein
MTTIGFRDAGLGVVLFDVRKADVNFPTELEKVTNQIETTRSKIEELNKDIIKALEMKDTARQATFERMVGAQEAELAAMRIKELTLLQALKMGQAATGALCLYPVPLDNSGCSCV